MAKEVVVTEEPDELPIEGNRIILDATAGKEKIQIIDQAGNEIVMNAVLDEQYVKIFSPKHETKFILGDVQRAVKDAQKKDGWDYANRVLGGPHSWIAWALEKDIGVYVYTKGQIKIKGTNNYSKWIEGQYNQNVLGVYTSNVSGLYTSIILGGKIEVFCGVKLEVVPWGKKLKIGKAKEYHLKDGCFEASLTAEDVQASLDITKLALTKMSLTAVDSLNQLASKIDMLAASVLKLSAPTIDLNGILKIINPVWAAIAAAKLAQEAAAVTKAAAEAAAPPAP